MVSDSTWKLRVSSLNKKVQNGFLFFSVLILLLLSFYQPFLRGAASYLAPSEDGTAEVAILEGTQILRKKALATGLKFLSQGKVLTLIVVLHQPPPGEELVGLPSEYPRMVENELKHFGLRRNQFLVIVAPVFHPITLSEAKFVLAQLAPDKVKRAFLISEGFHTRRSLAVYQSEGSKLGIRILAHPYYSSYEKENWWLQTEGVRAFVTEYLKLGYYVLRGYIPLKMIWSP